MEIIHEIFHDLMLFTLVAGGVLIVSGIVISLLPHDNPLRQLLTAFCARIGMTLGAVVFALPIEPIPGLDALYDIAMPMFLIYYWFTFFRDAIRISRTSMRPAPLLHETFTPPAPLPRRDPRDGREALTLEPLTLPDDERRY